MREWPLLVVLCMSGTCSKYHLRCEFQPLVMSDRCDVVGAGGASFTTQPLMHLSAHPCLLSKSPITLLCVQAPPHPSLVVQELGWLRVHVSDLNHSSTKIALISVHIPLSDLRLFLCLQCCPLASALSAPSGQRAALQSWLAISIVNLKMNTRRP